MAALSEAGRKLGLEMEMAAVSRDTGRSHAVTGYFETLARIKAGRGEAQTLERLGGRAVALAGLDGHSGLDNGYNLLETAFAPVAGGPGGLGRLAAKVTRELRDARQALDAEGAALLNASEHPDCPLSAGWYAAARVDRPIYRDLTGHRGWLHRAGIDAKAQNSPCTAVPPRLAARALNAVLALAPASIALFANSPLEAGRVTGLKENRLTLWERMLGPSRFAGDHRLHRLPGQPFAGLGDYFGWMFGPGTVSLALPWAGGHKYKDAATARLQDDPSLEAFLRSPAWPGVGGGTQEAVTLHPSGSHFEYAQFAQFLDARWRYRLAAPLPLGELLAAWRQPGALEELLTRCGADGYIEGRASGAVFADAQLLDEAGPAVAASAPIAPSALQLGLLRNLDQAEQLWRDWGWRRLRALRPAAIRHALADGAVHALARDVLAVARAGLPRAERHWLDYAEHAARTRRTGADRLLALWREAGGDLARVCARREVIAPDHPAGQNSFL